MSGGFDLPKIQILAYLCIRNPTAENIHLEKYHIMELMSLQIILTSLPRLFVEGGLLEMSILTVLFVGLLFAAWKAPQWVKEIGCAALAFSVLVLVFGWYRASVALETVDGAISPSLVWGGVKVSLIQLMYGLVIYLVSLIIRIVRKPRL